MTPKRVLFLVIGLLFAIFVFQNAQVVEVRFLFWSAHASRALVPSQPVLWRSRLIPVLPHGAFWRR